MKTLPAFFIATVCLTLGIGCTSPPKEPEEKTEESAEQKTFSMGPLDEVLKVRTAQIDSDISNDLCTIIPDSNCVVLTANGLSNYEICLKVANSNSRGAITLDSVNLTVLAPNSPSLVDTCGHRINPVVIQAGDSTTLQVKYCAGQPYTFQPTDSIVFYLIRSDGNASSSTMRVCRLSQ